MKRKIKKIKKLISTILATAIVMPMFANMVVSAADVKKTNFNKVSATSATAVTLKWKKISASNGYEIFQKKAGEKFKKIKTIKNKKTISCKISNLSSATKYTYKIRTYKTVKNKKQYSSFSAQKTIVTKPIAPTLTTAVEKDGKVTLQWKKVAGAQGYVVYKKTEKGNTQIKEISGSGTSVEISGKAEDVLTVKAYLNFNKSKIYSGYSKEIVIEKKQEDIIQETPPVEEKEEFVTEEQLKNYLEEIKKELGETLVSEEKVNEYIEQLKNICQDKYIAKEDFEKIIEEIKEANSKFVTKEQFDSIIEEIKTLLQGNKKETYGWVDITDTLTIENCYYAYWNGEKVAFDSGRSCYLPVNPGDKFKITGTALYDVALALFFDKNGDILDDRTYLKKYEEKGKKYYNETIVIPQGCYNVAFGNFYNGGNYTLELVVKKYQLTYKEETEYTNSVLYEKRVYFTGDSITDGVDHKTYADILNERYEFSVTNDAQSWTTLAVRTGYNNSICERVLEMDVSQKYDYIILQGGFNDLFAGVEIGQLSAPQDFGGYYDKTTVIGALETICHHIVNNCYEAKKLFVLGHSCSTFWPKQIDYWNAIKSVLEKWGIPYVDLKQNTNLCKYGVNDTVGAKYFVNEDGIHPTEEAYKIFYLPIITKKLESI